MKTSFKLLLLVEAIVCFGPAAIFLPIGVMMVPMQIAELIAHPQHWRDQLWFFGLVICGVVGIGALCFVLAKLWDNSRIERPLLVLVATALGLVGLVSYAGGIPDSAGLALVLALPMLSTAHILFLARHLFICPDAQG